MKKIIITFYFFSLILVLFLGSCEQDLVTFEGPYHVRFTTTAASVAENATAPVVVKVHFVGPKPTAPIDIQIAFTGATRDVDFTLSTTTLTIPAGQFFAEFTVAPIDNVIKEPNKVIRFSFASVSGGIDGGFGNVAKEFVLTIVDNDCAVPSLVGNYTAVNSSATPAACGNPTLANQIAITQVSQVGNVFTYQLSDITGGMYAKCYGAADNPGQITSNLFDVTLANQPDVVYGDDFFNGTGKIECNGNFTITWSNGYGDRATTTYTKVN